MKLYKTFALLCFSVCLALPAAGAKPEKGSIAETKRSLDWTFTPDPALPNVLILGDSISIGYTLDVRAALEGVANVYRPVAKDGKRPENCSGTINGVKNIDRWLSMAEWDVIHFNWGLHDLKHVKTAGTHEKSNNPNDPTQATVEVYAENMKTIVDKLKATGARLVFATTTPVVEGTLDPLRTPEAPVTYNTAAVNIMKANDIRVNDLHSFAEPHLAEWQLPRNVHFKPQGSAALAGQVAKVITEELAAARGN